MAPALAGLAGVCLALAASLRVDAGLVARVGLPSPPARALLRRTARHVGAVLPVPTERLARLRGRLDAAGSARSVEEVLGTGAVLAAAGVIVSLVSPMPGPILAPVLAAAGMRAPELSIARAVKRRRLRAERETPQFLDLLAAAVSAGLSPPLALRRAVEVTEGPLAEELGRALRAVDLGSRWRHELGGAAGRLDLPELRRAVAALTRTDALGSSLSEALLQIAVEARESRRAALAERARKAPVKMLFPLVFLVLPAFLLLTVVPVLLTTLQSIR